MLVPAPNYWVKLVLLSVLSCVCLLAGCDGDDSNKEAERELAIKEGDARATGSACRQAGRALEDCYNMNPTAQRASVFSGWRDMNDYMRENKMSEVKPTAGLAKPSESGSASVPGTSDDALDKHKE